MGYSELSDGSLHAFLWDGVHGMKDLENLPGNGNAGWSDLYPARINDRGWMCGTGQYNGRQHAILLKPTNIVHVSNNSLFFQTTSQSIWTEGPSAASFDTSFGPTWSTGDLSLGLFFHPTIPFIFTTLDLGECGVGVAGYSDNGKAQLHLHVDASAGGLSINYPVAV